MTFNKTIIAPFLLIVLFLTSCGDDKPSSEDVKTPATYSFERDGKSSVSYGGQTTRIAMATELIGALKKTDKTATDFLNMYTSKNNPFADSELNASTKSVRSKVAASKDFFSANQSEGAQIKTQFETWMNSQVTEVFPSWNKEAKKGIAGQLADGSKTRYVSAKGLEYDQAIGKGLIGALMLDQIVNNYLSPAVLDEADNKAKNDAGTVKDGKSYTTMEHKWDEAYGYLFGASENGADPVANIGKDDKFLNKYLGRVDGDSNFTGISKKIFDAFKLGRAAIVAKNYSVRDKQADIIKEELSKVIAVRSVYYLQSGKKALAGEDFGGAFHDLSEAYGFIYSLRFTRKPGSSDSYFSKSEVDGFLSDLMKDNGFWSVSGATLDAISDKIAAKFDFTVAQAAE